MKRVGNLWEELVSFENLHWAYRNACCGKRNQRSVERFEYHREYELREEAWLGHARTAKGKCYRSDLLGDIVLTRTTTESTLRSGRLVEQQRQELPLLQPEQERSRQTEQQLGVPALQHSTGG